MSEGARRVTVGKIEIGRGLPLVLIAGPCVIEDEDATIENARRLKELTQRIGIPFIFKSSYDKANRSSISSFRGPGLAQGMKTLSRIKARLGIPVLSDVHSLAEIEDAARILDVIQIPAFLSRQTDLIVEAAKTQKPVNLKKGQFLSPQDMKNVIEKVASVGNHNIILTERGTSFGYNNLVSDMRSLPIMRGFGYPVIYDATHSVQLPGGRGSSSGGQRQFVKGLARAAVAMGCDGLFLEVHTNPDQALCDGSNMLSFAGLENFLKRIKSIHEMVGEYGD